MSTIEAMQDLVTDGMHEAGVEGFVLPREFSPLQWFVDQERYQCDDFVLAKQKARVFLEDPITHGESLTAVFREEVGRLMGVQRVIDLQEASVMDLYTQMLDAAEAYGDSRSFSVALEALGRLYICHAMDIEVATCVAEQVHVRIHGRPELGNLSQSSLRWLRDHALAPRNSPHLPDEVSDLLKRRAQSDVEHITRRSIAASESRTPQPDGVVDYPAYNESFIS